MDEERTVVDDETNRAAPSDAEKSRDGETRLRPAFLWGTDAQIRRLD